MQEEKEEKKEIGQRLIQAMHKLGLDSKAKIKAATGLTDHAIWRYGEGNRAPSLAQLKRLALALPQLDLYWILTGQSVPAKINLFRMPTLTSDGHYNIAPDWYKSWLEERRMDQDKLAWWGMSELTWLPIIMPGDHIIFDRSETDLSQSGPYLMRLDGGSPILRRVEPAGNCEYLLSSGTPNTILVKSEEIEVLGRVAAVLHGKRNR